MITLRQARAWCAAAHGNQGYGNTTTDDGGMDGSHPYKFHLAGTEGILLRFGIRDSLLRQGAWGHDVVEDTDKTVHDLLNAGFHPYVVAVIWACSDGEGATRKERKREAYRKINQTPGAIYVKLADRIFNVEHSMKAGYKRKLELYRKEQREFERTCRRGKDPIAERMWDHLNWVLFSKEAEATMWKTLHCCAPQGQDAE